MSKLKLETLNGVLSGLLFFSLFYILVEKIFPKSLEDIRSIANIAFSVVMPVLAFKGYVVAREQLRIAIKKLDENTKSINRNTESVAKKSDEIKESLQRSSVVLKESVSDAIKEMAERYREMMADVENVPSEDLVFAQEKWKEYLDKAISLSGYLDSLDEKQLKASWLARFDELTEVVVKKIGRVNTRKCFRNLYNNGEFINQCFSFSEFIERLEIALKKA